MQEYYYLRRERRCKRKSDPIDIVEFLREEGHAVHGARRMIGRDGRKRPSTGRPLGPRASRPPDPGFSNAAFP
jgi:hypothetical protein